MNQKTFFAAGVAFCVGGAWWATAVADRSTTAPPVVYSGQVLEGGEPVPDGSRSIGLSLWTEPSGATGGLCDMPAQSVTTTHGNFSLTLSSECADAFETNEEVYVQLSVDGTVLPRSRAGAVPYAVRAEHASILGAPRRIVVTGARYSGRIASGALVGYAAARAICQDAMGSPTAHLCYGSELARARQMGLRTEDGGEGRGFTYAPEGPNITEYNGGNSGTAPYWVTADCGGFTSAASDPCGTNTRCMRPTWDDGPVACSTETPLLCCD